MSISGIVTSSMGRARRFQMAYGRRHATINAAPPATA